jgi:hypothetical protein
MYTVPASSDTEAIPGCLRRCQFSLCVGITTCAMSKLVITYAETRRL